MKSFFFILFAVVCLNSCTSGNSPEEMLDDDMEMMEDEMTGNTYAGNFISVAHTTTGVATVNNDKTILKTTGFKTDSGPVLEMYLATNTDADNYISLGVLKGLDGDYEYTLPENVDYDTYKYVIVWCVDFSVNFGYAVLEKS